MCASLCPAATCRAAALLREDTLRAYGMFHMARSTAQPAAARPARTQSERRNATRDALIEATIRVLVAEGYAGTTVRTISAAGAVSPGALQHHFASKEALMMAALGRIFEEVAERLEALGGDSADPAGLARRIVATLWAFYGGPRYLAAAEILINTRREAELHGAVRDCRLALGAAYRRMWDRLMQDAPLGPEGRHTLLQFVIATMRGLALLKVHEPDAALYEPQLEWLRALVEGAMRRGDEFLATSRARPAPDHHESPELALV